MSTFGDPDYAADAIAFPTEDPRAGAVVPLPDVGAPAEQSPYDVVVAVSSAGGLAALHSLLAAWAPPPPAGIVIAQHTGATSVLTDVLGRGSALPVQWIREGDLLQPGVVFICPPATNVELLPATRPRKFGPKADQPSPIAQLAGSFTRALLTKQTRNPLQRCLHAGRFAWNWICDNRVRPSKPLYGQPAPRSQLFGSADATMGRLGFSASLASRLSLLDARGLASAPFFGALQAD
jgi:hypothetical protein